MVKKAPSSQAMSSAYNATDSGKKRIEHLFTRFAVFYGHLWRSQFKSDGFLKFAKEEWLKGLQRFNDEELSLAIIECRDFCEMPPSLPQLIGICRDIRKRKNVYKPVEDYPAASKKVVEENIKQCKEYLFKTRAK